MNKTLINILGAGRSGTTMLDLMLGNDDESFSLGEVQAWFRPFRKHHFELNCNCNNTDCKYWNRIKYLNESEFHEKSFDILKVNFLIDSSKNLVWMYDSQVWAKKNNIKTINFLIYKPILNYIYSIWKRGESIDIALYRYKLYHKRFFESKIPAYSISFEELVNKPAEILDNICKITKQPYNEDRKSFWKKEHHHLFGSSGTRVQTRKKKSNIQSNEEFLEEFKKMIPRINKKIEEDKQLSRIIEKLQYIDYKTKKKTFIFNERKVKPYWYYYLKIQNKIKSFFPENNNKY